MANLTYKGKITFSDMVPGLKSAADTLMEKNAEVTEFLEARQKNVKGLQSRVQTMQDELTRAQDAAQLAQDILSDANSILDEAKGLVSELANALDASGIYLYQYVGRVDAFGGTISSALNAGLPDKRPGQEYEIPDPQEETIAANIVIVGGDGGFTTTINRIGSLFGQIGGNASEIVSLYTAEENQ